MVLLDTSYHLDSNHNLYLVHQNKLTLEIYRMQLSLLVYLPSKETMHVRIHLQSISTYHHSLDVPPTHSLVVLAQSISCCRWFYICTIESMIDMWMHYFNMFVKWYVVISFIILSFCIYIKPSMYIIRFFCFSYLRITIKETI